MKNYTEHRSALLELCQRGTRYRAAYSSREGGVGVKFYRAQMERQARAIQDRAQSGSTESGHASETWSLPLSQLFSFLFLFLVAG